MRRIFKSLAVISLCMMVSGCSQKQVAEENITETGEQEEMTYMSSDGYQIRYNASEVESVEVDEHTVQFKYLDESAGDNNVMVSFISGKQPEEALYELTESWGDQDSIERTEGFFPGTSDKWGYWRTFYPSDGETGTAKTAIAGEYNGGVLMYDITENKSGDSEKDTAISDVLSGIVSSITYDNFEAQTIYSNYPGTYTSDRGQIILNDDHTGTFRFQDDIEIYWGSYYITDGNFTYEFSIEGDSLYLDYDGEWVEFQK